MEALTPYFHILLEFLLGTEIKPVSPSTAVCPVFQFLCSVNLSQIGCVNLASWQFLREIHATSSLHSRAGSILIPGNWQLTLLCHFSLSEWPTRVIHNIHTATLWKVDLSAVTVPVAVCLLYITFHARPPKFRNHTSHCKKGSIISCRESILIPYFFGIEPALLNSQGYCIGMTDNPVCVVIWNSYWLGKMEIKCVSKVLGKFMNYGQKWPPEGT